MAMPGATLTPQRPWRRLHASTWCVLVAGLVLSVLVIVPGELKETWGWTAARVEHGWPWVYLSRRTVGFAEYEPGKPPWLIADGWNWSVDSRIRVTPNPDFSFVMLLIDLAVAAALVLLLATAFEWWRRQRRRIWQIYLSDLLLGLLGIALLFGWWHHYVRRHGKSELALEQLPLYEPNGRVVWQYGGPAWLAKLAGTAPLPRQFDSVAAIDLEGSLADSSFASAPLNPLANLSMLELFDATDSDVPRLAQLQRLEFLTLHALPAKPISDRSIPSLTRMTTLRTLHIGNSSLSDEAILQLRTLTKLERLSFGKNPRLTRRGLNALQRELPNCSIEHWFEDDSEFEPTSGSGSPNR
jgi:hypothetical protein